ncbi:membrane protein containing HD superfamily hydrolase domain [Geminocystis sp. NIES-3708]|uniref:HD family phosphohydrolase n=1 Tax=Geminocystis sp. NIES-3708 TaxID=1615909 RepID=UPI0005FC535E|nr:HDIG domain-containing metalloprotein [Geminocystis sp. NIES-3708]BAQ60015.1 membrane protein containing HD superfamily hydrolase domain [Geminocystis sp. NIES-3708]
MNTLHLIRKTFQDWQKKDNQNSKFCDSTKESNNTSHGDENKPVILKWVCKVHTPIMILLSVTSFTGSVSYRFYNQPKLAVGTISPTKIVAPRDADFVDSHTTEELRKKTRSGLLPMLKQDVSLTLKIQTRIDNKLEQIDNLRNLNKKITFVNSNFLSSSNQKYIHSLPSSQWQKILVKIKTSSFFSVDESLSLTENEIIKQLLTYKKLVNSKNFENLLSQLEQNRNIYQSFSSQIDQLKIGSIEDEEKRLLWNIDNITWQEGKKEISQTVRQILAVGISTGLPEDIQLKATEIHLENDISPRIKNIAVNLITNNLESNLIIDEEETKRRAEKAAQAIQPVVVTIGKGEVIVDAGEKITQEDFVLLDNFGLSRRSINWTGIAGTVIIISISLVGFMTITNQVKGRLRRRDQFLLWLLSLSVPIISIFDVGYNSLPALGFLVSSFYGPTVAVTNLIIMTGLTLFQMEMMGWEYIISSFAGGLLASFMASRLHSREELALLGAGVGLTQGSVYFIIYLIGSTGAGTLWYAILPAAIWHGTVGLTYSVLALGISPYLERFFDLITPIRLAELSNPNRPLLKRLATEAPGTFQHTMFVASLAEAAARKLHCNVELVRAGTLYHDIGKMHDPLGFIENQMGGPNKHDMINNPYKSAEIIKKHVSEGIIMAKKCGLPQAIQDFIPQHQGTLLISYFYYQAKTQVEGEGKDIHNIDETLFSYDGPIPQSRETGIVMLADGCEAALRSLKEATPDQAMAMVNKIFKARWRDHQLDESGIKYEELPVIAEVFVNIWQQFNHQRITYPKGALEMRSSSNN